MNHLFIILKCHITLTAIYKFLTNIKMANDNSQFNFIVSVLNLYINT